MLHIPANRAAVYLGLLGLVPFIVLASCLWLVAPVWQPSFARALVCWGAVVLAFTGAVHWGFAASEGGDPRQAWRYLYGIFPALLAFVVSLCPPGPGLFLIFCGLVASFIVDRTTLDRYEWYVLLRAVLTVIACICLYAGYKAL